jgi:hypothetical protein
MPEFKDVGFIVYGMVAAGLAIIYTAPTHHVRPLPARCHRDSLVVGGPWVGQIPMPSLVAAMALDKVVLKFRREGTEVEIVGQEPPAKPEA